MGKTSEWLLVGSGGAVVMTPDMLVIVLRRCLVEQTTAAIKATRIGVAS